MMLCSELKTAFATLPCTVKMAGKCWINLRRKLAQNLLGLFDQDAIDVRNGLIFVLLAGEQKTPRDVRQPHNLHASYGSFDEVQPRLTDNSHSRQAKRREDFHGMGFANRIRYIVIPHQNDHWHAGICQPSYALRKSSLPGRIRITVLIDITRKNRQMHTVLKRIVNGIMHRASEVEEAPIQARGSIEPTVIFHAKVHICQMQQP